MLARCLIACALLLPASEALVSQEPQRARFESAFLSWNAGDYVAALTELEALLEGPAAGPLLEDIARLTGELFPVQEVTVDGGAVRWSPDGKLAMYESGSGGERVTRILRMEDGRLVEWTRISGAGMVVAPDGGEAAFLVLEEGEALDSARAKIQAEIAPTDRASFQRLRAALARAEARFTHVVRRNLATGEEVVVRPEGLGVQELFYSPDGTDLLFLGSPLEEGGDPQVFRVAGPEGSEPLTSAPGPKSNLRFALAGRALIYAAGPGAIGLLDLETGDVWNLAGTGPVISADGSTLAFLQGSGTETTVQVLSLAETTAEPRTVARADFRLAEMSTQGCPSCPLLSGLALSPRGDRVAVQGMPREDWEIFLADANGDDGDLAPLTREIQHDLFPHFLASGLLMATKGEGRHRRSYLYDPETGEGVRLFRNNTLRTVAPEYEWAPSPDGTKLLVVAERDGNTVSPERGVYLVDLARKVTREDLLERVRWNLSAERALRENTAEMYALIEGEVRELVGQVSVPRLFVHEEALYGFGSKYITQPGNHEAIAYLVEVLRGYGYEPELQWFEPRGTRTANVVVRIPGSVSPDVVYAVSAHFDSNARSPGADDNTSATVGLLEMARILAGHPLPATVEIALFTGEEAGLLGSREYVRRAVESGKTLVGALNNDMVGWAENHRLDNTIRYSNDGIRDLQHGAAILFSDLITYDARYYKSTDAAAYYDAYGDIVGGIGSYPILANPHYHQSHDVLETVNHQLVAEVAKVTLASTVLMASSPSRLEGVVAEMVGGKARIAWEPAVESDVVHYRVEVESGPGEGRALTVTEPLAELEGVGPGSVIRVKAVNGRGLAAWDWARVTVGG